VGNATTGREKRWVFVDGEATGDCVFDSASAAFLGSFRNFSFVFHFSFPCSGRLSFGCASAPHGRSMIPKSVGIARDYNAGRDRLISCRERSRGVEAFV
jgi:hypothetical protein